MTFSPVIDSRWLAVLAAVLVLLPLWFTARNRRLQPPALRWGVLGLRLLVSALLVLVLANPVAKQGRAAAPSPLTGVVLVDTSQSMSLGTPSRLDQGRRLLLDALGPTLAGVRLATFAATVDAAASSPAALAAPAVGRRTCLGAAVARGVALAQGSGVRNLVVVSDGRADDPAALSAATSLAAARGIAVSVVPVGEPPLRPNVALVNCLAERQAPAGSRLPVTAVVRVSGGTGQPVDLVLEDRDGNVLARDRFPAVDGTISRTLSAALGEGDAALRLRLLPLPNELSPDDNELSFTVHAVHLPIRVLYMEGSNHKNKRWDDVWEYEFLAKAYSEDGQIETDVLTVDEQRADGGKLYSVRHPEEGFPTSREKLLGYDVVICSDINRTIFSDAQLAWTVDLVATQGGGFCMIGGYTAFGAGKWDRTVWEQMIPVDMKTEADGYTWETVTPQIPDEARQHPLWHLDEDPDRCARILAAHPPFLGFNLVNRAKPAARVLAWHEGLSMPLIAVQPYGRGRSMAFLSDAAGGWGERYQTEWGEGGRDNRYYRRFWVNAVRWLAENSLSAQRTPFLATAEAINYLPGETVRLQARRLGPLTNTDLRGWKARAELAGRAGVQTTLELDEQRGLFVGSLTLPDDVPAAEGAIHVVAEGPPGTTPASADVALRVLPADRELADPNPDLAALRQLAEHTGGEVFATSAPLAARLRPLAVTASAGRRLFHVPLWDRAWLWFLMTALLSAEWFLRKTSPAHAASSA
jgi:uncharacterized membrane protein